ncbi:MAG: PIN domain-containing protein [Nitrospirae bacterium]|nr:PIN domain-containing protein [Nitrospirota bacterium]
MKKLQLYLETSVWNYYFADDAPEKREITLRFFDKIREGEYEIFISDIVVEEIGRADATKKQLLLNIIGEYGPTKLIVSEEVAELAQQYISEGALPTSKIEDAMHAAVATVFEVSVGI